jgi:hypothetical protein
MENTVTVTTIRVMWTCRRQTCKKKWGHDYVVEGYRKYRILEDGSVRSLSADFNDNVLRCPDCASYRPVGNTVVGRYSTKHQCGAKCMNATGPSCDCSCGGKNHGMNHVI